jgi:hypothetical protein
MRGTNERSRKLKLSVRAGTLKYLVFGPSPTPRHPLLKLDEKIDNEVSKF